MVYFGSMANINQPPQKVMANLLHVLPAFADKEKNVINGIVELNSRTINKYELIVETGHLKLDRVGYSSLAYPVSYGAIPCTWDHDNDLLDFVIANVTEPLIPGSLVEARVIGVMKFEDGGERDDKIITVLSDDKRMDHITSYKELGDHWIKETEHYFEMYKHLKKPGTCKVLGFGDVKEANEIIADCQERYIKDYLPKFDQN